MKAVRISEISPSSFDGGKLNFPSNHSQHFIKETLAGSGAGDAGDEIRPSFSPSSPSSGCVSEGALAVCSFTEEFAVAGGSPKGEGDDAIFCSSDCFETDTDSWSASIVFKAFPSTEGLMSANSELCTTTSRNSNL
jgi:hypothetical protein